jgi:hypothetical protein
MKVGARVRKIGMKRMAYVRGTRQTCLGVECYLTKPLGGFHYWLASELEIV